VSNALAIAAVTAVLQRLLVNGLVDRPAVGDAQVRAEPPDRVPIPLPGDGGLLNLFLYQVTPNPGWRNVGLPVRDPDGRRVGDNPLALDLHYLLTAYGTRDLHAEILLGYGMQILHETPVLSRAAIRGALRADGPADSSALAPEHRPRAAALADQVELVKITPASLGTEEMSRLWSALQAHYRPTVAYQVSVVLIESETPTRSSRPVRERRVLARPLRRPVVRAVSPQIATLDDTLTISGDDLGGSLARVDLDGTLAVSRTVDDQHVEVALGQPALAGRLRAGVRTVQVVQMLDLGEGTGDLRRGAESNVAAFVLAPVITTSVVAGSVSSRTTGPAEAPLTVHAADLTIGCRPAVERTQRVELLLSEASSPADRPPHDLAFRHTAPPDAVGPFASLTIHIQDVPSGTYLVRLRVDGAESALTDADGTATAPAITLPLP
jgi:hypothetical protein